MIKSLFIDTFIHGEYFMEVVFWILFLFFIFLILGLFGWEIIDEYQWAQTPSFVQDCTLVSQNYFPRRDRYVTVWDCGEYGRLVADDEYIFRFAKDISTLILKKKNEEVRIIGIEK